MKNNYTIDTSRLKSYYGSFLGEQTSFTKGSLHNFDNSYIKSSSNTTISTMSNNLSALYSNINNGYQKLGTWLNDYIEDNEKLDSSLKNGTTQVNDSATRSYLSNFVDKNSANIQEASYTVNQSAPVNTSSMQYETGLDGSDPRATDYYNQLKKAYETVIAVDNNRPVFEEMLNDIAADKKLINDYINANYIYNHQTKKWEQSHIKGQLGVETVNSEYIDSLLAEYDDYVKNFQPIGSIVTEPLDEVTWLQNKVKDLEESEEYINNYITEISEAAAAYKKYYPLIDYLDLYESDGFGKFQSEYEQMKEYKCKDALTDYPYGVNKNDPLADYEKNGVSSVIKIRDGEFETELTVEDFYKYTTKEEQMMYHYIIETQGNGDAANEYLLRMVDNVNLAKGYEMAESYLVDMKTIEDYEKNADNWIEAAFAGWMGSIHAFFGGVDSAASNTVNGISNLFSKDNHMSAEQYRDALIAQHMNEGYYGGFYKSGSAFGSVLPMIAVAAASRVALLGIATASGVTIAEGTLAAAGSTAGLEFMFLSSAGNAKVDAMQKYGASPESGLAYGFLIGCSETTLQYFLGKIPLLNTEWGLSVKNLLLDGVDEGLQVYVQHTLTAIMYGETIDLDAMNDEALEAFWMGILVSGGLNMGSTVLHLKVNGELVDIKYQDLVKEINEIESVEVTESDIEAVRKLMPNAGYITIEALAKIGKWSGVGVFTLVGFVTDSANASFMHRLGKSVPWAVVSYISLTLASKGVKYLRNRQVSKFNLTYDSDITLSDGQKYARYKLVDPQSGNVEYWFRDPELDFFQENAYGRYYKDFKHGNYYYKDNYLRKYYKIENGVTIFYNSDTGGFYVIQQNGQTFDVIKTRDGSILKDSAGNIAAIQVEVNTGRRGFIDTQTGQFNYVDNEGDIYTVKQGDPNAWYYDSAHNTYYFKDNNYNTFYTIQNGQTVYYNRDTGGCYIIEVNGPNVTEYNVLKCTDGRIFTDSTGNVAKVFTQDTTGRTYYYDSGTGQSNYVDADGDVYFLKANDTNEYYRDTITGQELLKNTDGFYVPGSNPTLYCDGHGQFANTPFTTP